MTLATEEGPVRKKAKRRKLHYYVHYVDTDRRLDEWVDASRIVVGTFDRLNTKIKYNWILTSRYHLIQICHKRPTLSAITGHFWRAVSAGWMRTLDMCRNRLVIFFNLLPYYIISNILNFHFIPIFKSYFDIKKIRLLFQTIWMQRHANWSWNTSRF